MRLYKPKPRNYEARYKNIKPKGDDMTKLDMRKIRQAQPEWFSAENKRLFGDVSYWALRGKVSGKVFLVRSTYAWTDMFGQPKKLHCRLNNIQPDYKIGPLLKESFRDLDDVKSYLKNA